MVEVMQSPVKAFEHVRSMSVSDLSDSIGELKEGIKEYAPLRPNEMTQVTRDQLAEWKDDLQNLELEHKSRSQGKQAFQAFSNRVVTRFATEFDTPEALKKYLHDHPDADKSKHSVAKGDGGSKSKGEKAKGPDATLANAEAAKSTSRSAETDKHLDEMKGLKKKVDDADHSAKKKFDRAYDKLLANGEAAEKAAEKLLKKYDNMSDGLEGEDKEQAEAGLDMLNHWLGEWKSTVSDHHRAKGELAHKKLQQAEQTHGYAQTLEKWVRQVSKSLKGDYQVER